MTPNEPAPAEADTWATYLTETARDHNPPNSLAYWRAPDPGTDPGGPPHPGVGATVLLDVVAAVDYLCRGFRPGFTVWDAIEEALRWWLTDHHQPTNGAPEPTQAPWDDPDPLRTTLQALDIALDALPGDAHTAASTLNDALAAWVATMADGFNAGYTWPHPQPRRGFPPPIQHPGTS